MNDSQNHEIDEVLSAYLDGEISERQQTELKRLAQRKPSVHKRLKALKRQKQILRAMPIEKAPATLVDDVRSAIERNLILDGSSRTDQNIANPKKMLLRRMLATAAMFLVPIGLLGMVVFYIVKPPEKGPGGGYVNTDDILNGGNATGNTTLPAPAPQAAKVMPFDGVLTFESSQYATVSNYIEKMVYDQGLIGTTKKERTVDLISYDVTAGPQQIANLTDTLQPLWSHCQSVTLSVLNSPSAPAVEITDIQHDQLRLLVLEDNSDMYKYLADRYAKANLNKDPTLMAIEDSPVDLDNIEVPAPILTQRDPIEQAPLAPDQPTVELKICVKRAED